MKQALKAGIFAYVSAQAFTQIGDVFSGPVGTTLAQGGVNHFLAHAVTGGVLAEIQGGKFRHGFAAAGIGFSVGHYGARQGWAVEAQFVATVVAGGTASEITGGKFANGATTAAFAFAFNQLEHQRARAAQKEIIMGQCMGNPYRCIYLVGLNGELDSTQPKICEYTCRVRYFDGNKWTDQMTLKGVVGGSTRYWHGYAPHHSDFKLDLSFGSEMKSHRFRVNTVQGKYPVLEESLLERLNQDSYDN